MSAVRRDVEALRASVQRAGRVLRAEGMYQPAGWSSRVREQAELRNKAMQHELDTLAAIVARLDKATAPKVPAYLGLPGSGTVARTLLEVLHVNALGHDHDSLRDLVGLTDAELAARITGAGPNTVRPRRLDLQRAGWVEAAQLHGNGTAWTLTADGRRAMDGLQRELRTHLMDAYLLDACGTAPRPGSLSVTTQRDHVDCLACLQLPATEEEVAAHG